MVVGLTLARGAKVGSGIIVDATDLPGEPKSSAVIGVSGSKPANVGEMERPPLANSNSTIPEGGAANMGDDTDPAHLPWDPM